MTKPLTTSQHATIDRIVREVDFLFSSHKRSAEKKGGSNTNRFLPSLFLALFLTTSTSAGSSTTTYQKDTDLPGELPEEIAYKKWLQEQRAKADQDQKIAEAAQAKKEAQEQEEAIRQELQRRATLPFDCLGGLCLNTAATTPVRRVVTVSDHKWEQRTEVCSNRIVRIKLITCWVPRDAVTGNYAPVTPLGPDEDGTQGGWLLSQVGEAMTNLGWINTADSWEGFYVHLNVQGSRVMSFTRTDITANTDYNTWGLALSTQHPSYDALCAPKRQQGL